MKLITSKELDKRLFRKHGFTEAFNELEPEFRLVRELIRARTEEGITQAELAKRMGTQQSSIARFESGRGNPTLDFIQRLARALDLTLHITVR